MPWQRKQATSHSHLLKVVPQHLLLLLAPH
jgi:hypothetical protein